MTLFEELDVSSTDKRGYKIPSTSLYSTSSKTISLSNNISTDFPFGTRCINLTLDLLPVGISISSSIGNISIVLSDSPVIAIVINSPGLISIFPVAIGFSF